MKEAAELAVAAAKGGQVMAVLVDKNTRLIVQGITGREGHVSRQGLRGVWNEGCGRCDAGQGRNDA